MYKNMNDYEILYMVGENNKDLYDLLYQKYTPLIYKISKNSKSVFKTFGYELEDVMQIGYMTLYKCSYRYNAYGDVMFFSYFKKAFKNALIGEIRLNKTSKREVLNKAFSYDNNLYDTHLTFKEIIPFKDDNNYKLYNKVFLELKNAMSFDLACVFELYFNGYNQEEISILLHKEINTIYKMYKEIKKIILTYKYLFLNKDVIQ